MIAREWDPAKNIGQKTDLDIKWGTKVKAAQRRHGCDKEGGKIGWKRIKEMDATRRDIKKNG